VEAVLVAEGLRKYFGNVRAVDGVSLKLGEGETLGIIGPNGAGKTTLLNLLSGVLKPDAGRILVRGERGYVDVTGWSPAKIARMGVARAFQMPSIFENLTVIDNVRAALVAARRLYAGRTEHYDAIPEVEEEAWKLLEFFGLEEKGHVLARDLAHGEKKALDIAIALALKPRVLLLDEPTAGMSAAEKPQVVEMLNRLKKVSGISVVVVEHDLDVVFAVSDRVLAMHEGRVISEGPPERVRSDPLVKEAYLGEGGEA
jgi:branched-chain amino acid transport system ATP-binding protein